MKNYNIGILGATGVVGREMMKILSERGFPTGEIRLFASEKSAGKKLRDYHGGSRDKKLLFGT